MIQSCCETVATVEGGRSVRPEADTGHSGQVIIDNNIIDPITGSVPHRSHPCRLVPECPTL